MLTVFIEVKVGIKQNTFTFFKQLRRPFIQVIVQYMTFFAGMRRHVKHFETLFVCPYMDGAHLFFNKVRNGRFTCSWVTYKQIEMWLLHTFSVSVVQKSMPLFARYLSSKWCLIFF